MLFFGGETLKDFAFAMAIGLALGSYSTIAVACPLFALWKTREPKYAKLQKKYGTEIGRFEFGKLAPVEAKGHAVSVQGASTKGATAGATVSVEAKKVASAQAAGSAATTSAKQTAAKPPKGKRRKRPDKK